MNKMRLNVDPLTVETFATGKAEEVLTGTVHAAMATATGACATCKGVTCFTSCAFAGGDANCTCPV
ncbi:MAG TPA: hypothetical protein VF771_00915 [Longimicrobiaceae bacterium]